MNIRLERRLICNRCGNTNLSSFRAIAEYGFNPNEFASRWECMECGSIDIDDSLRTVIKPTER